MREKIRNIPILNSMEASVPQWNITELSHKDETKAEFIKRRIAPSIAMGMIAGGVVAKMGGANKDSALFSLGGGVAAGVGGVISGHYRYNQAKKEFNNDRQKTIHSLKESKRTYNRVRNTTEHY